MPRVRLFHWRAEEAKPLIALLRAAGYTVDFKGIESNGNLRSMTESPTYAAVIDLSRMPSHGRYVAAEIRARKTTRHIPIVFVDGEPEKVEKIRTEIPDAIYTARAKLASALKRVKPVKNPVAPSRMMASNRTAAQKLGITAKSRVAVVDPPAGYLKAIGAVPEGASLEEDPEETLPLTLWFVQDPDAYLSALRPMARKTPQTRLWIIYPKMRAGGLNQNFIRASALAVGLVDYKICSVDDTWSGMLFTRKKRA